MAWENSCKLLPLMQMLNKRARIQTQVVLYFISHPGDSGAGLEMFEAEDRE